MPVRCASRYAGGMMVSASLRPIASWRVQPKVFSACAFQVVMMLSASMPTNASCAVSRIKCARASLAATWASASRRRSSAIATAIRFAVDTAKFCSSAVHARLPPTCSTQNTPITLVPRRSGTSSIAPMLSGSRYDALNPLVRGSAWASGAAITRWCSMASK